jgi:hypothetical protein
MVNSGVRGTGTKDRNLRTEVDWYWYSALIRVSYLLLVKYAAGIPGDFVATGSSLVLPRAAAGAYGQYSTLRYTGVSIVRYARQGHQRGAPERRREGGTRERGKGRRKLGLLVVRQQELG